MALARTNATVSKNIPGIVDVPMIPVKANLQDLWKGKTTGGNDIKDTMVADFITSEGNLILGSWPTNSQWSNDMFRKAT